MGRSFISPHTLVHVRERVQIQTHSSLNGLFDFKPVHVVLRLISVSQHIARGYQISNVVQIPPFFCETFPNHHSRAQPSYLISLPCPDRTVHVSVL